MDKILFAVATFFAFTSCDNNKPITPADNPFYFCNTYTRPMNVVLYRSVEDYYTNAAPITSFRINAKDTFKMDKGGQYEAAKVMDWYSDDYLISGWHKGKTGGLSIYFAKENNYWSNQYIDSSQTISRVVCINGGNTQSTWKDIKENYFITFRKDFTATINDNGAADEIDYEFWVESIKELSINLDQSKPGGMYYGTVALKKDYTKEDKYTDTIYLDRFLSGTPHNQYTLTRVK